MDNLNVRPDNVNLRQYVQERNKQGKQGKAGERANIKVEDTVKNHGFNTLLNQQVDSDKDTANAIFTLIKTSGVSGIENVTRDNTIEENLSIVAKHIEGKQKRGQALSQQEFQLLYYMFELTSAMKSGNFKPSYRRPNGERMNTSNVLEVNGNFKTSGTYQYQKVNKNGNHDNEWVSYFKDAYVHERAKNRLQGSNGEYSKERDNKNMIGLKSIMGINEVKHAPAGTGGTGLPKGAPISSDKHKQLLDQINDLKDKIKSLEEQIKQNAEEFRVDQARQDKVHLQLIEHMNELVDKLNEIQEKLNNLSEKVGAPGRPEAPNPQAEVSRMQDNTHPNATAYGGGGGLVRLLRLLVGLVRMLRMVEKLRLLVEVEVEGLISMLGVLKMGGVEELRILVGVMSLLRVVGVAPVQPPLHAPLQPEVGNYTIPPLPKDQAVPPPTETP